MLTRYHSPYASPPCTVPFASPLTVPQDVLLRSPKLHAAYESQHPELPEIPDDIGHILVHYLHTGNYESLKPKEADTLAKQISELRTSIRAYATARAYDLPELMRLAEKNIEKHGEGLTLPHLLEITKEAHPGLSEADVWFLAYLKRRIRPHLEDPKALLGSNLLDQISNILSPNRVLLRTVLEMFCERINTRPEVLSPITSPSPASSRPTSPPPPATPPVSVLQMRSRAIPREDLSPLRKKAAPWPSADEASLSSWSKEASPEPLAHRSQGQGAKVNDKPAKEASRNATIEANPQLLPAPAVAAPTVESELKDAIESDMKPILVDNTFRPSTPVRRRDRRDSAKAIPMTPELEVSPMAKETPSTPEPLIKARPHMPILRQADSGFWEATPEHEPLKDSTSSLIEIEPDFVNIKPLTPEPIHELQAVEEEIKGTDTRDFATPEIILEDKKDESKVVSAELELPLAPEVVSRDPLDSFPDMDTDTASETVPEPPLPLSDSKALDRISEESVEPEATEVKTEAKVEEPVPEADKVEPTLNGKIQESGLTVQEEAAKQPAGDRDTQAEPKPATETPQLSPVPDSADAAGSSAPKATEPGVEPSAQPTGLSKDLPAQTEHVAPADDDDNKPKADKSVGFQDAQPATPSKDNVKSAIQATLTPERQKSWRKRFLSPVLFGRGM